VTVPVDVEVSVIDSPVSGDCGAKEKDAVGAACAEAAVSHIVKPTTTTFEMPVVACVAKCIVAPYGAPASTTGRTWDAGFFPPPRNQGTSAKTCT
jgi:hypothetical protein